MYRKIIMSILGYLLIIAICCYISTVIPDISSISTPVEEVVNVTSETSDISSTMTASMLLSTHQINDNYKLLLFDDFNSEFLDFEELSLENNDEVQTIFDEVIDEEVITEEITNEDSDSGDAEECITIEYEVESYSYGKRIEPCIDIVGNCDLSQFKNYTSDVDTSEFTYLGNKNITGYDNCVQCCGKWAGGPTASGVDIIPHYTCAASSSIKFGTVLYIDGYGFYVVEDRGNSPVESGNNIDIVVENHDEAYENTRYNVAVYIVPSGVDPFN